MELFEHTSACLLRSRRDRERFVERSLEVSWRTGRHWKHDFDEARPDASSVRVEAGDIADELVTQCLSATSHLTTGDIGSTRPGHERTK